MSIPKITDDRKDLYFKLALANLELSLAAKQGKIDVVQTKWDTITRLEFESQTHYGIDPTNPEHMRGILQQTRYLSRAYDESVPDTTPLDNPQRMRREILAAMVEGLGGKS